MDPFLRVCLIGFLIFEGIAHDADVLPCNRNRRVSQLLSLGDLGRLMFWKGDTIQGSSSIQSACARVVLSSCKVGFLAIQGKGSASR